MSATYKAPTVKDVGEVTLITRVTGTPPDAEVLFKNMSAGSVGFAL